MKSFLKIQLVLVILIFLSGHCEMTWGQAFHPNFSVNLSRQVTCSWHGLSINAGLLLQEFRRSMLIGVIYDPSQRKISGGEVEFKYLFNKNCGSDQNWWRSHLTPYLSYNFIYRSDKYTTGTAFEPGPVRIGTVEHYLGGGVRFAVLDNLFLITGLSAGTYLGSFNPSGGEFPALGFHRMNSGLGLAMKVGLTYRMVR
jgi:hypothetical protein